MSLRPLIKSKAEQKIVVDDKDLQDSGRETLKVRAKLQIDQLDGDESDVSTFSRQNRHAKIISDCNKRQKSKASARRR